MSDLPNGEVPNLRIVEDPGSRTGQRTHYFSPLRNMLLSLSHNLSHLISKMT